MSLLKCTFFSIVTLFFLLFHEKAKAQIYGMEITSGKQSVEIPFTLKNGYIVIILYTNYGTSLNCVLDTGTRSTMFLDPIYKHLLAGDYYPKKYFIYGADRKAILTASLMKRVDFYTDGFLLKRQNVFILDQSISNLDNHTGLYIDAIIGMEWFRRFIVEIDYNQSIITLHEREQFKPKKGFESMPISVEKEKMFLNATFEDLSGNENNYNLLLDSGASLKALFAHEAKDTIHFPKEMQKGQIGMGLGGTLEGYLGHSEKVKIGSHELQNIIHHIYFVPDSLEGYILEGKHGMIGNQLMMKFNWVFDIWNKVVYIKPNKFFDKNDEDKSGLSILASGEKQNDFYVDYVIEDSPAANAGIKKGDKIIKYNIWSSSFLGYTALLNKFRKQEGKKISLTIERNGEKMKFNFQLKKIILPSQGSRKIEPFPDIVKMVENGFSF